MNEPGSRYDELVQTLNLFATQAAVEPLAFGSAIDKLDHSAYTFTATLAVLPFLQPIPLGFFALIGSATFIALGLQLLKNEPKLVLPLKIRNVTLGLRTRQTLVNTCLKIIGFLRKFSKPRLSFLIEGKLGRQIGGFIYIAVGILLAVPLGGVVPFKNLFPSLAILFHGTAEVEQDGLMVAMALLCVVLTVIFYGLLIYLVWKFGTVAINHAINHFFWK
ncbi:MAG: exopolysaccharide biosynthesis protein [Methylotenera sp.]|nr:exopolysaccharide biosynthesis protein [Methylotenera sp.]